MEFNKRNIAAYFLSKYLILSGKVNKVTERAKKGEFILSVYFHDPSKQLFESTVRWFQKHGYRFLSTDDVAAIADARQPFPEAGVVLTVDDGWRGNKENIAAVAHQYKIPVTIFASTSPIANGGGYWWSYIAAANTRGLIPDSVHSMKKLPTPERERIVEDVKKKVKLEREALTIDELKEISRNGAVSIGSHTVTHPILTKCSDEQSSKEIAESRRILKEWLGTSVEHFAYPNGEFGEREIKFLKDSGYKTAYTTNPQYLTAEHFENLFTLPRFDVLENISFTENICRMTGVWFNRNSK